MKTKVIEKDYLVDLISEIIASKYLKTEYVYKADSILNNIRKKYHLFYNIDISYSFLFDIIDYYMEFLEKNPNGDIVSLKDYIYKKLLIRFDPIDMVFKTVIYPELEKLFNIVNDKISRGQKMFPKIDKEYLYIIQISFINDVNSVLNKISIENFSNESNMLGEIKYAISKLNKEVVNTTKTKENIIISVDNLDNITLDISNKPKDYRPIKIFEKWNVIHSKRLGIFMAPTGYGKSHLLCHIASDYLINAPEDPDYDKNIIFYFSFENTKEETLLRILSNITDIKMNSLTEPEEFNKAIKLLKDYLNKNELVICELPPKLYGGISTEIIEKYIEDYIGNSNKKYKIYGIIIDYLDLMSPSGFKGNKAGPKWESMGELTIELKSLAMKLNTPVITATQTNREGEAIAQSKQTLNRTNIAESYEKIKNADILIGFLTSPVKIEVNNEIFNKAGKFFIMKHRYSQDGIIIPFYADFSRSKFFTKETLENGRCNTDTHEKISDEERKSVESKNEVPDEVYDDIDKKIHEFLAIKD